MIKNVNYTVMLKVRTTYQMPLLHGILSSLYSLEDSHTVDSQTPESLILQIADHLGLNITINEVKDNDCGAV